jgi:hypothetical protein
MEQDQRAALKQQHHDGATGARSHHLAKVIRERGVILWLAAVLAFPMMALQTEPVAATQEQAGDRRDFAVTNAVNNAGALLGDGRDGVMPSSGWLDSDNGTGHGIIVSGASGTSSVTVIDAHAVWRVKPGDAVLLHQTRGSNAGCWEINWAVDAFQIGQGAYRLRNPLQCSYGTDAGANRAQIMRVPQYTTCNMTGEYRPIYYWQGSFGGIFAVLCRDSATLSGSINVAGWGYTGGAVNPTKGGNGQQGESERGGGANVPVNSCIGVGDNANGSGGGGGRGDNPRDTGTPGGGAGGGNGATGQRGACRDYGGGQGGISHSDASGQRIYFGGGGGSGGNDDENTLSGAGGRGGGIVFIGARNLQISGSINAAGNGGGGGTGKSGAGGGGGGGSVFLTGETVAIGASRVNVAGGPAGLAFSSENSRNGGAGGAGRIRVEYCNSFSGSAAVAVSSARINCGQLYATPTPTVTRTPSATPTRTPIPTATATTAEFSGKVVNGATNAPVAQVRVCVVGTNRCATTNSNGSYRLTGVAPGNRTLRFTRPGLATLDVPLQTRAGQVRSQNAALVPLPGANELWIVVTWADSSQILDPFLSVPRCQQSPTKLGPGVPGWQHGCPYAELKYYSIQGAGNMASFIVRRQRGNYIFAVHNESASAISNSPALSSSGAVVDLYGPGFHRRFTVPTGRRGRWWTVFSYNYRGTNNWSSVKPSNVFDDKPPF